MADRYTFDAQDRYVQFGADPAVANPYANGLPDEKQQQLATRYADIFGLVVKHRTQVSRVTFWGLSDADSWLNRGRMNHPLLVGPAAPTKAGVPRGGRRAQAR